MSSMYTEIPISLDSGTPCLTLGLPTDTGRVLKHQILKQGDVATETGLHNDVSVEGGFCQMDTADALCRSIAYRLSEDKSVLTLVPLVLNSNMGLKFQALRFVLPSKVIDNCVTVVPKGAEEDALLVDIVTEDSIVISLVVDCKAFVHDGPTAFPLQPDKFYDWCSYSLPYFFQDRRPFFLKNLDGSRSIMALADGGLLLLRRDGALESFVVEPFNDSSYLESLKSRLFFSRRTPKLVPDYIEIGGFTVSSKCVLDAVVLKSGKFLLTFSIDKKIKVWSLETGACVKEHDFSKSLPEDLRLVLISRCLPKQLLHSLDDTRTVVFLPIGNNYVKIMDLSDDGTTLTETTSLEAPLSSTDWLFHSCDAVLQNSKISVWVSWCFGDKYMFQKCELAADGVVSWAGCVTKTQVESNVDSELYQKIQGAADSDTLSLVCLSYLLDGFSYDSRVLESAVKLFKNDVRLEGLPLKQKIIKAVTEGVDTDDLSTLKKQWLKFDNVCADVVRTSKILISVCIDRSLDEQDGFFVVMNSHNFSVVKRSSVTSALTTESSQLPASIQRMLEIERVDYSSLKRLVKVLDSFKQQLSAASVLKIEDQLYATQFDTTEKWMGSIFQSTIFPEIDKSAISSLIESLNSIHGCMDCMQLITDISTLDVLGYKPVTSIAMGALGESLVSSNIRTESILSRVLLLELIMVVLTVDICDPMVEIFENAANMYKTQSLILRALKVPSPVPGSNLVLSFMEPVYEGGALVKNANLNYLTNDIFVHLTRSSFGYYVVASMLAAKTDAHAVQDTLKYLEPQTPITLLLTGLVQTQAKDKQAYDTFYQSADIITAACDSGLGAEETKAVTPIQSVVEPILTKSKVDYFYNLALLFESNGQDSLALKCAVDSLAAKNELQDKSDDTGILAKVFSLALKLDDFNLAYETVLKAKSRGRKSMIKQFIYKLFQDNQLSRILEYQFTKDFDTVDELIYGLGESSALSGDVSTSLKYYKTCYSLRLKEGDYRSAVEALYRFNCIALELLRAGKFSDTKLLLDNYLIVFNLLRTLQKDDRWVVRRPVATNGGSDKLMTLDDLESEYNQLNVKYGDGIAA